MIFGSKHTPKTILALYFFIQTVFLFATEKESIWMFPNVGQHPKNVQYQIDINQGDFFIDNKGFTFSFFQSPARHSHGKDKKRAIHNNPIDQEIIKGQTIRTVFVNANLSTHFSKGQTSFHYKNFHTKEQSYSKCYGKNVVRYSSIYNDIDLELSTSENIFKYSYYVAPFGNVDQIRQKTIGALNSYIDKVGNLHHKNIFGEIIEKKPKAWNVLNGNSIQEVEIEFKLENNEISYYFPKGYNKNSPLVIDPELIFSSFTGSISDNWGFTATNDNEGNLYSAGICFGIGYPTTTGVFDINYRDGEIYQITNGTSVTTIPGFDVVISKFSKDGKSLLYSSYLGGKGNETPNSIIVNNKDELLVFGATSSIDFPTSLNAHDNTYNNGSEFKTMDFYFSGSDIFVSHFNQNGDQLLGSTYVGGSNNDGISVGDLIYNYGDNFRGEINLTANNEVLIISTTNSADFPLMNSFQQTMNGNTDAIILKLSPNLDQLLFSSYLGGTGEETGNSIHYSKLTNKIYITGGTTSSEIISIQSNIKNNYFGGKGDGYIGIINNNTNICETFRFIGTPTYDQSYFVQTDSQSNIYLFGQTEGKIEISTGKYGNPNSGQFISKLNPDLSQIIWNTTIGGQSGFVEISPTAFLVSDCNEIFLTGWGSAVNQYEKHAMNSSTLNFPVTDDAIQKTTDGDNFYIAVLNNDCENLKFGSFFGGMGTIGAHVDGGTCRFDKRGGIYHAVCGGCGGIDNGFTTTPGVWSEVNNSSNCNIAAFKIELNKIVAQAKVSDSVICSGGSVKFTNMSKSADEFEWDFGDNSTSTDKDPIHIFKNDGKYKIRLIANNSKQCIVSDTTFLEIRVKVANDTKNIPTTYLCNDSVIKLEMENIANASFRWISTSNSIINENSNRLTIKIIPPMIIKGVTIDNCTTIYYEYKFEKFNTQLDFDKDISICLGDEAIINLDQFSSIDWKNHPEWKNKNQFSITPTTSKTYYFSAKTTDGCPTKDSLHVEVLTPSSKLLSFRDTTICFGDSIKINTKYISNFSITPLDFSNSTKNITYLKPKSERSYLINYTDPCGNKTEDFSIRLKIPFLKISNDTSICLGDSILISGTNMKTYEWQTYEFSKLQQKPNVLKVSPEIKTEYSLLGKDEFGCVDRKKTIVSVFPKTKFKASIIKTATWQNPAEVIVVGENLKSIKWYPKEYLSSDTSFRILAHINKNQPYSIIVRDENNCKDSSTIYLDFEATLYIPNAFYPDSKNGNSSFKAVGINISAFEMKIYNRWGELLKILNDIDEGWDGKFENKLCPNDVYIWKVNYITDREEEKELTGHVTLLR